MGSLFPVTKLLYKEIVTKWNKNLAFKDGIKHGSGTSTVFQEKLPDFEQCSKQI